MSDARSHDLLAQLAGHAAGSRCSQAWTDIVATPATHDDEHGAPVVSGVEGQSEQLDELLERINRLATADDREPVARPGAGGTTPEDRFLPIEPASLEAAKLTPSEVEAIVLKFLLARGESTGHNLADQIRLPFGIIDELLQSMKQDQLVVHKGAARMNDYVYQLTDIGREMARLQAQHCTYFGAAPVDLDDYLVAVAAQSLVKQSPSTEDLQNAFSDLLVNDKMLKRVGPAINSGRGMFLFGAPGNGKSSIAERVTLAFGESIWIPRALGVNGEIMRLYDPNHHFEQPLKSSGGLLDQHRIDKRWIRIARPTIIVGGELTMNNLEVTTNPVTGVSEAPIQLKSNCGTLVIDDFGRQRMSIDQLLNRWIVPLEKGHDFLNMANGKKIQVPFDQLIVFSTNLEPRDLVDDAFLRRVPYKIEVIDPTEEEFRQLFRLMAPRLGLTCKEEIVDYLIATHYRPQKRPFRYCQPRDLLMQICNFCRFMKCAPEMTRESIDLAVENYFSVM